VSLIYDALLECGFSYVFYHEQVFKVPGMNISDTTTKGLVSTKVFVPFCSYNALFRMKYHDPNEIDNLLLEWMLALECYKTGTLSILPIPYGTIDEVVPFLDFDYRGKNDIFYTLNKLLILTINQK